MNRPGADRPSDHPLVLMVEHEAAVAELARRYLERDGLTVRVAATPAQAAATLATLSPCVVVLDLTMPGLTPAGVRRKLALRGHPGPPQLICLEGPGGLRPRHVGITCHDDRWRCLRRPFSPRQLSAGVREAVRKQATEGAGAAGQAAAGKRHITSELVLDTATRRASVAGAEVLLTATQCALLAFLASHAGRVFTRQQLLEAVWGRASAASARNVDVHVAGLRAKLGAHSPIRTVRGVGYAAWRRPGTGPE